MLYRPITNVTGERRERERERERLLLPVILREVIVECIC